MTQDILINETSEKPLPIEEEKTPEPLEYDDESANLVKDFQGNAVGDEALEEIVRIVCDNFTEGYENTRKYRERVAEDWTLFAGDLKPKSWPHKFSANAHVPITLENICRILFRAEDELFGDMDVTFGVVPLGNNDEYADILTQHGNWQLRSQIIDFGRQMSRSLLALFFIGDVTIHSYYSEPMKMNRHEMLTPDEFVTPYVYVSTMPDWSDVPWKAKIVQMYDHDLEAMRDKWENIDKLLEEDAVSDGEPEMKLGDKAAGVLGLEKMESSPNVKKLSISGAAPYKLICYEGYFSLPDRPTKRYCQVVVDYASETILSLLIHERPNWQDQQRFNAQQQELMQYRASLAQYQQAMAARMQQMQMMGTTMEQAAPMMGPMQYEAASQAMGMAMSVPEPEPPLAPEWMQNPEDPEEQPEPVRKEPVHLYAHGVCIEPLVGNLGLGYGRPLADHNRAANTALSQFTDAATMANVWSLIVPDGMEFNGAKDGSINICPGVANRATGMTSSDIRESIIELKPGPANPQLMELVAAAREWGQETAQAPEALSGEPGKSGETYRGLAARIEQATKQLANPTRRFANTALKRVLINNAYLNSIYMPDEEIFAIQKSDSASWQYIKAGRKLYDRNYNVEIRADLRFVSQTQRIQEADEMVAFANQPDMAQNIAFKWEAARRALLARGRRDMVPLLGPKPPPPSTPFGIMAPAEPPPGAQVHNPAGDQKQQGPPQGAPPPAPPEGIPGPGGQPEEGAPQ